MTRQQRASYIEHNTNSRTYREEQNGRSRAYVEGNTVRKLNAMPERAPERIRERERQVRVDRQTRANRQRAMQMSLGYLFFLSLAVAMTVGICALYIHLQSEVSGRMRNVASLESQILDLKTENDAAMGRIESSVNMDEIRNTAMNDMGMVYPNKEQIVPFTVDNSDYMNQYRDIPEK